MTYDPDRHHRQSIRLRGYDYARAGGYFVTICTRLRENVFGDVVDGATVLTDAGRVVQAAWEALSAHDTRVVLDAFVIMPNHVHGVIVLSDARSTTDAGVMNHAPTNIHAATVGARFIAPTLDTPNPRRLNPNALGAIVRAFKARVTHAINIVRTTPGVPVWQRNYYEHVIRNEAELNRIRQYIANNPKNWAHDRDNPMCIEPSALESWETEQ